MQIEVDAASAYEANVRVSTEASETEEYSAQVLDIDGHSLAVVSVLDDLHVVAGVSVLSDTLVVNELSTSAIASAIVSETLAGNTYPDGVFGDMYHVTASSQSYGDFLSGEISFARAVTFTKVTTNTAFADVSRGRQERSRGLTGIVYQDGGAQVALGLLAAVVLATVAALGIAAERSR